MYNNMIELYKRFSDEDLCLRALLLLFVNDIVRPLLPLVIPCTIESIDGRTDEDDFTKDISNSRHELIVLLLQSRSLIFEQVRAFVEPIQ